MDCCSSQPGCSCDSQMGISFEREPRSIFKDMLGPFPDEVLMTVLDRILYLCGATKIIRTMAMGNQIAPLVAGKDSPKENPKASCLPPPSCRSSSCTSVYSMLPQPSSTRTCCSSRREDSCRTCPSPCIRSLNKIHAATCSPRQRAARVDFANPVDDVPNKRQFAGSSDIKNRLKRSLSICSMACQNLKNKLNSQNSPPHKKQTWLWTRLTRSKDGCKVYEVFKNSNVDKAPSRNRANDPVIIFLVMPNGYIMPFESVAN
ncbi:uncharacterized protein [Drosophila bipectinata]|uniref:uncharacterized protein n=1 Tax=Drosophila bipectinata TaxID=42026 RepID=UPI0007E88B9A|nr:uncharacterized protein LOC108127390 [Drosophila bipectinata]